MKRLFRIQYASDLHLEHYDKVPFQLMLKPAAPFLALTGAIGDPGRRAFHDLLLYCSRNWRQTFITTPYPFPLPHPNVHLLNDRRVEYDDVAILGSSMSGPPDWLRKACEQEKKPAIVLTPHLSVDLLYPSTVRAIISAGSNPYGLPGAIDPSYSRESVLSFHIISACKADESANAPGSQRS